MKGAQDMKSLLCLNCLDLILNWMESLIPKSL